MRESSPHRHTGVVVMREVLCLLGLGVLLVLVDAGLQVSEKTCGQMKCKPMQFCEPHKNTCDPCSEVCDRESHNYQEDVCEQQCQDYIHFQQFVTREETMGGEDINSKVARLTVLVTATLVLVVLLLLVLVAAFFFFYWHRRRQRLSPPDYSKSPPSPGAAEHGKMNGLKIEMPPPPPPSSTAAPPPITPATTSTPLSTRPRYPKEDPTLEYGAYDNPALTPSPVFENNKDSTPTATTTPVSRRQESSF